MLQFFCFKGSSIIEADHGNDVPVQAVSAKDFMLWRCLVKTGQFSSGQGGALHQVCWEHFECTSIKLKKCIIMVF